MAYVPEGMRKQVVKAFADSMLPIWSIYQLVNETQKEVYIGVSKDPEDRILDDHAQGKTETIKHWKFDSDTIKPKILISNLTQPDASEKAHAHEKSQKAKLKQIGYKVHQTSGT